MIYWGSWIWDPRFGIQDPEKTGIMGNLLYRIHIKLKKQYIEQYMPDNLMAAKAAAAPWPADPHCHTSARLSAYTRQEKEIFTLP